MGITSQLKNGGWGALAIYVYSLLIFLYWDVPLISTDRIALVAAAIPSFAVMFTVVAANDWLNDFWAGGNLKRSTETILRITGGSDFFDSAQQEVKDAIDDFDEKGYSHHVSILAGILLAIVVPITGYAIGELIGLLIGLGLAAIILRVFSVRSFRELNRLAKQMSVPYVENYENQ
jgi:hypothetical protein